MNASIPERPLASSEFNLKPNPLGSLTIQSSLSGLASAEAYVC